MRKKFFLMVNVEQKIALMMVWQLAMQNVLQMIGSTRKYLKPIPEPNTVVYRRPKVYAGEGRRLKF